MEACYDHRVNSPLALYHGYWATSDRLILTVVMEESNLLIRVLKSDRQQDGTRKVLVQESNHEPHDVEGAKRDAESYASAILERPLSGQPQWHEYADLGLLIRLL